MSPLHFLVLLNTLCLAESISFRLVNNCRTQTIWPAVMANIEANSPVDPTLDPLPAGLSLPPGASFQTKPLPLPWGGRIWGRQLCSDSGADCLIGSCSSPSCWLHSSGNTTLFEIHADHAGAYYDISLVDAFTTGISAVPDDDQCPYLTCEAPPYLGLDASGQPLCPVSNMMRFSPNTISSEQRFRDVYGCLSNCALYKGNGNCCRPGPEGRGDCVGANPWFKKVCPNAYAFASDDPTSTKFCKASNFTIKFSCPSE